MIKFEKSLGISKLIGPLNYCIALLNACFDTSSKYTNLSNQPSANTLASSVSEIQALSPQLVEPVRDSSANPFYGPFTHLFTGLLFELAQQPTTFPLAEETSFYTL